MANSAIVAERHIQNLSVSAIFIPAVQFSGRVLLSAIFLISGLSKPPPQPTPSATSSPPELPFAKIGLAIAVFVEIVGGLALVVGYRTRVAAAVLAAFTVATALAFHNDLADQNQFFHFFKNIAMAGGLLQVVAFGAPRLSLDPRRH